MFRPAVLAPALCVLATIAAAVSFARGAWVGVVWLLLAGLTSNMAWYYARRAKARTRTAGTTTAAAVPATGACASGGGCGVCVTKACG